MFKIFKKAICSSNLVFAPIKIKHHILEYLGYMPSMQTGQRYCGVIADD